MHDLAITGGVVHDGLGSPGQRADLPIDGERVVAVASDIRPARRTVHAEERFVGPGFVDAHSHSDAHSLMADPQPFKLLQGVTTEVVGNCGFSVAPLDDASGACVAKAWGDLFPGVAVVPGSFADYMDRIGAGGPTNNIAPLVGQGTLRLTANGTRRELADPGSYTEPDVSPVGIEHVVLGGTVVVDDDVFTGERAGALLRAGRG